MVHMDFTFGAKLFASALKLTLLCKLVESSGSGGDTVAGPYRTMPSDLCNQTNYLQSGDKGTISSPNYPSSYPANVLCEYIFIVDQSDQRIKLTFQEDFDIEDSAECKEDYLHIGNNMNFKNMKSLTSYKFCGREPPLEIVSRRNEMWIVFKTNSYGSNKGFSLNYQILPEVHCENNTDLACSDVQCVKRQDVCDGHQDCSNGLDEYCGFASSHSESCFLCKDNSCILPKQPLNSVEYGKKWWWLCDEWSHCQDGTDERMDICIPLVARSDAIFECQAAKNIHVNHSIVLLTTFLCDGIKHCLYGEDEEHPKCHRNSGGNKFDKRIILFPILAIVIFSIFMIIVYNLEKCKRCLHLPRSISMTKRSRLSVPTEPPNLIEGHQKGFSSNLLEPTPESSANHSCTDTKQTFV